MLGALATILAATAIGCGNSSSEPDEAAATYRAKVVTAEFPARQQLGQTTLLRIGVRNDGRETIPTLVIGVTVAGKEGQASTLPFGFRDPQPGLAEPDRPIWVLSDRYPKLAGSSEPGGADTSNSKAFAFGALKPGQTTEAVWKVTASRTGSYDLRYQVDAGLGGAARAETAAGKRPVGSLSVTIESEPPNTTVNDNGEVVEIDEPSDGAK